MSKVAVCLLLALAAGCGSSSDPPADADADADGDADDAVLFEPGTDWVYGTSTDWVGRLVEAVSGTTLDAYFRDRIFTPLRMRDTHFNVPDTALPRLAPAWRSRALNSQKSSRTTYG